MRCLLKSMAILASMLVYSMIDAWTYDEFMCMGCVCLSRLLSCSSN